MQGNSFSFYNLAVMRILFAVSLLFIPLFIMFMVNKHAQQQSKAATKFGIKTINPLAEDPENCSWYCNDHTTYCQENHVKVLKNHYNLTDSLYYGLIRSMRTTDNYNLANVIFLVFLVPLLIAFFSFMSFHYYLQRKKKRTNALN